MSTATPSVFGTAWFTTLASSVTDTRDLPGSLRVGETTVAGTATPAALLAVVPNADARFPRARNGEVGLEEGYALAGVVNSIVAADRDSDQKRVIVTVIDVPGQAYGYIEELAGIHQALAAATNAFASARLAGHPVISLMVGSAISGAFLATGLQANRLIALDHDGIAVQVMSKQSSARITRRTIAELDAVAEQFPVTAYDGASFAKLGALHALVHVEQPAEPTAADTTTVATAIAEAVESIRASSPDLLSRLNSDAARTVRASSVLVRERVALEWNA